jgi:nucleoside 2-deoxyribosyltransferase
MFRKQPQAFLALPQHATPGLRQSIEETLLRHGVKLAELTEYPAELSPLTLVRESDLVIADITGANPNVMIEVGMALGLGKSLLLLSRRRSVDEPFALAAHQVAVYEDVTSVSRYLDLWLRDAVSERALA